MRITFETPGGRLISILDGGDPGDVDYFILYESIGNMRDILLKLRDKIGGGKLREGDANYLIDIGFLHPTQ